MKVTGLIAEYNPFHNGHAFHIEKSKLKTGTEHIVVVMSGNFVQRGTPAILDKFQRTKAALESGADLVLELPLYSATASAEFFALGAVDILHSTGIVDWLCFGSELGGLAQFFKAAQILSNESSEFKLRLKSELNKGISYPKARQNALKPFLDNTDFLNNPNNILGIEYIKALIKMNSPIEPVTILREKSEYHSLEILGDIASATAIRQAALTGNFCQIKSAVPPRTYADLVANQQYLPSIDSLSAIFQYILKSKNVDYLYKILDINEGLENRIIKASNDFYQIEDILTAVKTKRYTTTKLRRAFLHILLDMQVDDFEQYNLSGPPYIRILGFKKQKSFLVNQLKKNATKPVFMYLRDVDKILDKRGLFFLQKEIVATDIYYLSRGDFSTPKGIEYTMHPVII